MAASGDTAIGESGQSRLQIPVDKGQRSTGKPLRTPPRHTFRRAGRLDENAEPSRTKVRRDSRTMRAFMLALLCGRRAKAYPINYLAIAKTGSTSLNIAIKEAQAAGHQCDDIMAASGVRLAGYEGRVSTEAARGRHEDLEHECSRLHSP